MDRGGWTRGIGWLTLTAFLSGCSAPIYLHSPSLETASATAADSFPPEAAALKPFDDQLTALDQFAARENLAVAKLWTAARDTQFAHLLGMADGDRDQAMKAAITLRMQQLGVVPGPATAMKSPSRLWIERRDATAALAKDETAAGIARTSLAATAPAADLSCPAVLKPGGTTVSDVLFPSYVALCRDMEKQNAIIAAADPSFGSKMGEIVTEREAIAAAQTTAPLAPSASIDALKKQIDAAVAQAKDGQSVADQLESFRKSINSLLGPLSGAAKVVALDDVSTAIDKVILGETCAVESAADKAKADSKCNPIVATSTAGRIEATWAVAQAIAQLADTNAKTRVAAQWLVAAKAIVSAQTQDAKLEADRAKDEGQAHALRLSALEQEAASLSLAYQSLLGPRGDCHGSQPGGDHGPNRHCAFASYVDAWNVGRIPAEVLKYQPVQLIRTYAVRRARIAAQKQHALALAAANDLKGYGAGGIKAEAIGQALFDIALIGTTAGR